MSAIFNSLNAHNFIIFRPILMKVVSKYRVYRVLFDKNTYNYGWGPLKLTA